jgi:ATP-dependent DNA ligase
MASLSPSTSKVACNMGLEGIVSKRLDHGYCAGRCRHWVKVKNPTHPAYSRVRDHLLVHGLRRPWNGIRRTKR